MSFFISCQQFSQMWPGFVNLVLEVELGGLHVSASSVITFQGCSLTTQMLCSYVLIIGLHYRKRGRGFVCKDKGKCLFPLSVRVEHHHMAFIIFCTSLAEVTIFLLLSGRLETIFYFNITGSVNAWHKGDLESQYGILMRREENTSGYGQIVSPHCAWVSSSIKWE